MTTSTLYSILVFIAFTCFAINQPMWGIIMFLLAIMEERSCSQKTIKNLRQEICELKNKLQQ